VSPRPAPKAASSSRTYLLVWLALLALTGLTVAASNLPFGRLAVAVSLGVASIKAWLVLHFFMHLGQEDVRFKLMVLAAIVTLTIIIGMTFTDIGYRYFEGTGTSHVF